MRKVFLFFIAIICFTGCTNFADGLLHTPAHGSANTLYEYSITINNFSNVTYIRDVEITVNPGEASQMRFSNDQVIWSPWESASSARAWILSERSSVKTVYAEFRRDGLTINNASDDIEFIEKLLPESFRDYDKFGTSTAVSADGSTAIMGAEDYSYTNASGFTYKCGGAVIYKYDSLRWNPVLLVPGGASGNDRFGASVSLSSDGNTALVGSPGYNGNSGRVLLYKYNSISDSWVFVTAVTGATGSYFGNSVALSKDGLHAACAAVYGNARKGEVQLYSVSTSGLSLEQVLRADDGLAEDRFGCSVSVNDDASVVVVGAEQRKVEDCTNSGTVYVFRIIDGSYIQEIVQAASPGYNCFLGCSVSVSSDGSVIVCGARGTSSEQGMVYVFRYNSLISEYTRYDISDNTGAAGDQFGFAVAASGDGSAVIAGSPYADDGATDTGKLSRYDFNGSDYEWSEFNPPSDPAFEKHLGISAAVNDTGSVYIAGAIRDIYMQKGCGTSYVFRTP